jgi:hypothetical protein
MDRHPSANAEHWRALLEQERFEILETGTQPATLWFLGRRSGPRTCSCTGLTPRAARVISGRAPGRPPPRLDNTHEL